MKSMLFSSAKICSSLFKWYYLKNETFFLNFLFQLWNLHQLLKILKQKKIVMANVFSKLRTVKDLVKPLSKKRRFRPSFDSQHVKGSQTLVKFAWEHFYQLFPELSREMVQKISRLLKFEIIGVFVNDFNTDYKYPVPDCENLPFHIQIQLSQKRKLISQFFCSIYGIYVKFWTCSKKETLS